MAPNFGAVFFQSVQHIDPFGGQQIECHLYPAVPVHGHLLEEMPVKSSSAVRPLTMPVMAVRMSGFRVCVSVFSVCRCLIAAIFSCTRFISLSQRALARWIVSLGDALVEKAVMDGVIAGLQLFKLKLQPPQLLLAAVLTGRQNAFHNAGEVRYDRFLYPASRRSPERRRRSMAMSSRICRPTLHPMVFPAPSSAPQAFVGGGEAAPAVIGAAVLPLFGTVREALAALAAANFAGERIAVAMSAAACRTVAAGQLPLHRLPRFAVDDGLMVVFQRYQRLLAVVVLLFMGQKVRRVGLFWIRSPQYFSFFRILVTVADDQRQLPLLLRIPASRSSRAMVLHPLRSCRYLWKMSRTTSAPSGLTVILPPITS